MSALLTLIGTTERWLCVVGFAVMAAALVADVGARLFLGHGIVGAPQFGLVGMLVTALFGVGLAADRGEHFRPQVLDRFVPAGLERAVVGFGHALTAAFFVLLMVLSIRVARESAQLEDVTALLRWPVWVLQLVFVLAFGFNAVRYLIFAAVPRLRPEGNIVTSAADGDDTAGASR
ncbi:MAG: TRAP transporter small permease [Pseudomonadota bacterium]